MNTNTNTRRDLAMAACTCPAIGTPNPASHAPNCPIRTGEQPRALGNVVAAAAPQDERATFEAWYTRFHKHAPLFKRDEEGTYLSPREDVAWKSWLGRAALPMLRTDEALAELLADANCEPGTTAWPFLAESERAEWLQVVKVARAELAAQSAAQPADAPTSDDIAALARVSDDFEGSSSTDESHATLMRLTNLGLLECSDFHVTPAGRAAILARTQEGAAS